jgi:acetyl esterase/lipase
MVRTRLASLLICLTIGHAVAQVTTTMMTSEQKSKIENDRTFFNGLGNIYAPLANVTIAPETIDGVSCYWFSPPHARKDMIVVYLHGGGYMMGSIHSHRAMVSHIAGAVEAKILFIEYGLSPEHPYPQGIDDVLRVYHHVLDQYAQAKIVLIGDSAGGGLLVSLVQRFQQQALRQPAAVVMISPWLNLHANTPSYKNNAAIDPILTPQGIEEYAALYNPTGLPEASPATIEWKEFPPMLILVGTREILLDDSELFYNKIKSIQKDAALKTFAGATHVWTLSDIHGVAGKEALTDIRLFLAKR